MNKKVKNFIMHEISTGVGDLLFVKNDDGSVFLLNKYTIKPLKNGYFKLTMTTRDHVYFFSSMKNAVTWCIYDKKMKYAGAARIRELDMLLTSLATSMEIHKKLIFKTEDKQSKLIYTAKLNEEQMKKRTLQKEMDSYVNMSKYWQTKKFIENQR